MAILGLCLYVEQFSTQEGPGHQVTTPVKCCEKSISFPPQYVLSLHFHTNTVDKIQVREWDHSNSIVVLNKRESFTKLAIVQKTAHATNRIGQFILLNLSLEKFGNVVYVES